MNAQAKPQLMKRNIDALKLREKPYIVWDGALPGFGLRVAPTGHNSFFLDYRPHGGGRNAVKRRLTIGAYGPMTAEQARKTALDALAQIRLGADPQVEKTAHRASLTVSELIAEFVTGHVEHACKSSTAVGYKIALARLSAAHGSIKAAALTRAQIARMHAAVTINGGPYAANRFAAITSKLYSWGIDRGLLPETQINPASRVKKNKEEAGGRFLSTEELGRLGAVLSEAETVGLPYEHGRKPESRRVINPFAVAAIRLLILTGARLREILHAKWEFIDFEKGLLNLPDSKTGKKSIQLNAPALEILACLPRIAGNPHIIAGAKDGSPRADLKNPWEAIKQTAGLDGVRLHDLRHSFASIGAGASMGLPIIGKLLGHSQAATTHRYAHLDADPLRAAANAIGSKIDAAMRRKEGEVIPLRLCK
jgi:integrase